MNTAVAEKELVEIDEQNFLENFLNSIHRKGWLGSAFIRDDQSKRIKAFFLTENVQTVGDSEAVNEDWHFEVVTRLESFFEQRISGDTRLLFEMATMKIAVDEKGIFRSIQEQALKEVTSFKPDSIRIKIIEKSLQKALLGAESCKRNNGNLSSMIIASKIEEIIELLFLKNLRPYPGTVYGYRYYRELERVPAGFPQMFESLLESGECIMRTERFSQCVQMLAKL